MPNKNLFSLENFNQNQKDFFLKLVLSFRKGKWLLFGYFNIHNLKEELFDNN